MRLITCKYLERHDVRQRSYPARLRLPEIPGTRLVWYKGQYTHGYPRSFDCIAGAGGFGHFEHTEWAPFRFTSNQLQLKYWDLFLACRGFLGILFAVAQAVCSYSNRLSATAGTSAHCRRQQKPNAMQSAAVANAFCNSDA